MAHFFRGQEKKNETQIQLAQYNNIILLCDKNTYKHCIPIVNSLFPFLKNYPIIKINEGEKNKSISTCEIIWNEFMKHGCTKNTLLLNVGGGVISDLGGFSASIYKRGIAYANIPTTLLAMVDASIGGKTGVNYNGIKNTIGTIQQPIFIYTNPIFLETLPRKQILNGSVETIKHALIYSQKFWKEIVKNNSNLNYFTDISTIKKSIRIKQKIVAQDEMDTHLRQILNFGHTIGHAIESESQHSKNSLLHGEAILLGMLAELKIAEKLLNTPSEIYNSLLTLKAQLFPRLNYKINYSKLIPYLLQDKKNKNGITMSLLQNVGHCTPKIPIKIEDITS